MIDHPERHAVISGLGISQIGRRIGVPGLALTVQSVSAALADSGLTAADIDGITSLGDTPVAELAAAVGISPSVQVGGFDSAGLLSPITSALVTVGERRARHVLVYRTVGMLGGGFIAEAPDGPQPAYWRGAKYDMAALLAANAFSAANWLAMTATRHMHRYGTTREQLGAIALTARRHAALNPLAVYREPLTMQEYLEARMVSTPFGLYDCDVPVDGSIAMVISHRDSAADCPNGAVRVAAIGGSSGPGGWTARPDYPLMASADAAAQLWSRTDLTPADVDVAQLYDGFSFLTLAWLEALGLCGQGESGPFVQGGARIALDGELPLNTYGGQLSAGRLHGYWLLHEACVQLRGTGGARQVRPVPRVAVAAAGGGPIAGCLLLTKD